MAAAVPQKGRPDLPAPANSFWYDSVGHAKLPASPDAMKDVDVLVLGAGIFGVTTAFLCKDAGLKVGIVEADTVCGTKSVTASSTAKLSAQHGSSRYTTLLNVHGEAAARAYARGQLEAISWVEAVAAARRIDCDLEKVTSYVFGFGEEGAQLCKTEAEAAQRAGLDGAFYSTDPITELPFKPAAVYGLPGMVDFHPRKWVLGLAQAIPGNGCWIAEGVRATGLDEAHSASGHHVVHTTAGAVRARHVVVATHFPIFDRTAFFARLVPVRENCVAGTVDAALAPKDAYLAADRSLSFRSAPCDEAGKRMLILCGEKYRTGTVAD